MDHAEPGLSADQRGEGSEGAGFRLTFLPQACGHEKSESHYVLWKLSAAVA